MTTAFETMQRFPWRVATGAATTAAERRGKRRTDAPDAPIVKIGALSDLFNKEGSRSNYKVMTITARTIFLPSWKSGGM